MAHFTQVAEATHPLLADFVALNEPETRRQVEREGDYFVVEGPVAIERLLSWPQWHVRGLAVLPAMAERLAGPLASIDAPVAIVNPDVMQSVVGFDLHRGALASVERQPIPAARDLLAGMGIGPASPPSATPLLLVAEGVSDHQNLGSLYRNAAAFGVEALLLDPTCADPFYRRSVRVSVGHVLSVGTGQLDPLPAGLEALHEAGVTTIALTPQGDQQLSDLDQHWMEGHRGRPLAVLVGAEGPGLGPETLAAAQHRVQIPMADDVDSLNVATAAAVALFQLRSAAAN